MAELDALDPIPSKITLGSGTTVILESLKARQFFKFLRIITHGAMPLMQDMSIFDLDPNTDTQAFAGRLLSVMVLSIPDAEDETLDFILSMCKPEGLIEGRKVSKADSERNAALWTDLALELDNPELDDLVTIIEAVVKRESADIQALGKRLASLLNLAEKTGQLKSRRRSSPKKTAASSEVSPEPSTSSPASTDGPTQ